MCESYTVHVSCAREVEKEALLTESALRWERPAKGARSIHSSKGSQGCHQFETGSMQGSTREGTNFTKRKTRVSSFRDPVVAILTINGDIRGRIEENCSGQYDVNEERMKFDGEKREAQAWSCIEREGARESAAWGRSQAQVWRRRQEEERRQGERRSRSSSGAQTNYDESYASDDGQYQQVTIELRYLYIHVNATKVNWYCAILYSCCSASYCLLLHVHVWCYNVFAALSFTRVWLVVRILLCL